MPSVTADALRALAPEGSTATDGKRLFAIGGVAAPSGPTTERLGGADPATVAAGIARRRERLTHAPPGHIVIASADEPAFAMPAAAWAARSGDPVLFAGTGPPPVATLKTLHHYSGVPVYVLGPSSTISGRAFDLIRKVAPGAKRVEGADPVANSIAFARYVDGDFGWGLTDPGHGLVIANDARPLDAAAAAPLAATGIFGPLLVTSSATELPSELREYLLDLKPGYETDPTRAVFNHAWLLGDAGAISVAVQSQIDDLVELVKIGSRAGSAASPPSQPRGSTKKP
jgi:hypothetical protein